MPSFLKGSVTARRFMVAGEPPDGFRALYANKLKEFAFKQPPVDPGKDPVAGWVSLFNVYHTDFENLNTWLFEPWAVFALRTDQKKLPKKMVKAKVDDEAQKWANLKGMHRCPPSVRAEIKDRIEEEWLMGVRPGTKTVEVAWDTNSGLLYLNALGENQFADVARRFAHTFGLRLLPLSPLAFVPRSAADQLLSLAPLRFRAGGSDV